jgi:hypothetical protein
MRCESCHDAQLIEIRLSLGDRKFTMHSCPACERRWWDRDGQRVALDGVLSTVAAR